MAVKDSYEQLLNSLQAKIKSAKDEVDSRKYIARYIFLKFEYESDATMAETPENQAAIDRMAKEEWTPEQLNRIDELHDIIAKIVDKAVPTLSPISERMYEYIHNYKIVKDETGAIIFPPEDEEFFKEEINTLKEEDRQFLLQNPDAPLYDVQGIASPERYTAISQKWRTVTKVYNHTLADDMAKITYNGIDSGKLFSNMRFHSTAHNRQMGVFCAYLMGVKGMSLEQAITLKRDYPGYDNILKDFSKFLYDNAVITDPPLSVEEVQKRSENVIRLMSNATKKLGEYKLPDIDFSDPEAVEQHKEILLNLSEFSNNFNQEFENFTKNIPNFTSVAEKVLGSKKEYTKITQYWKNLNGLGGCISDAYRSFEDKITPQVYHSSTNKTAFTRAYLDSIQHMFRNKTYDQYIQDLSKDPIERLVSPTIHRLIATIIPRNNSDLAEQYLSGNNKEEYIQTFNTQKNTLADMGISSFNDSVDDEKRYLHGVLETESKSRNLRGVLEEVFGDGAAPEELYRRVKNTQAGEKLIPLVGKVFTQFTDMILGKSDILDLVGKDDLDTIKVDGIPVKEYFGEKYNFITDKADKELMIRAELVNELSRGSKEVTSEQYGIKPDKTVGVMKTNILAKPKLLREAEEAYLMELNDLNANFVKIKKLFQKYQDNPDANFKSSAGAEGSEFYKNMIKALNNCIEKTTVKANKKTTVDDVQKAMLEYQKAAATYYKERKGLIIGPITSKGQVRLNLANDAKNFINSRCDKLNIISRSFYTPKAVGKNPSPAIGTIAASVEKSRQNRGLSTKFEELMPNPTEKGPFEIILDNATRESADRNKNLNTNIVYNQIMKGNYKYPLEKWNEVQEKSVKIIENAEKTLADIKAEHVKLSSYIFGEYPDGIDENTPADAAKGILDRATEVVTAQILADRDKRIMAQGIACDETQMESLKNNVREHLAKTNSLKSVSADQCAQSIDANNMKNLFMHSHANDMQNIQVNNQRNRNASVNNIIENQNNKGGFVPGKK